jgi:hypothetical protein
LHFSLDTVTLLQAAACERTVKRDGLNVPVLASP